MWSSTPTSTPIAGTVVCDTAYRLAGPRPKPIARVGRMAVAATGIRAMHLVACRSCEISLTTGPWWQPALLSVGVVNVSGEFSHGFTFMDRRVGFAATGERGMASGALSAQTEADAWYRRGHLGRYPVLRVDRDLSRRAGPAPRATPACPAR